jgi:hypothetical protein
MYMYLWMLLTIFHIPMCIQGSSWSWLHGCWIYNYLCNKRLSPLKLWVRTPFRRGVLDTTLCDKVCQLIATGPWFSPGTPVCSTNKTDRHDITEILLNVALNTINQSKPYNVFSCTLLLNHYSFSCTRLLIVDP